MVTAELIEGGRIDRRFNQKETPARAFEPLNDAFQPDQCAVDAQDPEQAAQACRKRGGREGIADRSLARGAFLAARLSRQPIFERPKGTSQGEVVPKGQPGAAAIKTVRQPA